MDVVKFIPKQFNRDAEVIDLNLNELDKDSFNTK